MSNLSQAIDAAIDLVKRNDGVECTPRNVLANVRLTPDAYGEVQHRGLREAVVRRMKQRGDIITDATRRTGGRPRDGYYETGLGEHKEQLRLQSENGRYTQNRIAAESAVISFMEERTKGLGYEPPWITIAEDVDRIYRMHDVTPPAA